MAHDRRHFGPTLEEEGLADVTAVAPTDGLDYQPQVRATGPDLHQPASYRTVLTLALPTLIEQVFNVVIGFTDTWVAGNGIHPDLNAAASAAVGTMTYLQWFTGIMTSALGVGATAIVARSIGAGRPRIANRIAGTALTAAFLVGVVIAVALYVFADLIVAVCGLHGQAHTYGVQYLQIMVFTICLQTAGMIGMASLRGAGDTLRPMLITGATALINVITVPTLAYGWFGLPALGIQGNALGTMIAFAVSGLATMLLLLSGWAKLRLRFRHFQVVPHILGRILRIGLPSWVEGVLLWGGQFAIVLLIINQNDAALATAWDMKAQDASGLTMAAHNTVIRLESFAFLPGFGFGIAASALVGQYLGAGRPQEARRAAHIANRLAISTMTLAALPMVLMPAILLKWVVDDPHVAEIGYWPMILAGLAQPGFAVAIIMSSGLRGAGETLWPLLATFSGMFLVRFPIVLFLAWYLFPAWGHPAWGLLAAWIGIFADLNFRAVVNGVVFHLGRWQHKRV